MVFAIQCVHCTAVCSVYYIAHCTSSSLIVCNVCVWLPDNCYTIKLTCDPVVTYQIWSRNIRDQKRQLLHNQRIWGQVSDITQVSIDFFWIFLKINLKTMFWNRLGGRVVRSLAIHAEGLGSIPGRKQVGQSPSCELVQLRLEIHTPQLVGLTPLQLVSA